VREGRKKRWVEFEAKIETLSKAETVRKKKGNKG
jgi:hypothetical protein